MGQKVSPHGLRVGVIKDWGSKWYADKNNFAAYLVEDNKIRELVKKKLYGAGVAKIVIERPSENKVKLVIQVARQGVVIGRDGVGHEMIKKQVEKLTSKEVIIDIRQVGKAEMDAQLVAERIAQDLEKRVSFRRAMKQAIGRTMKSGAKGIKVLVSGRLGGAEIARNEKYSEGNVPLHTLRADIDYGFAEADTTYGKLGVKVWINHGEILDKELQSVIREIKPDRRSDRRRKGDNKRGRSFDRRDRRNDNRKEKIQLATQRTRKKKPEPEVVTKQEVVTETESE